MKKAPKILVPQDALLITDLLSVGEKTAEYLRVAGIRKPSDLLIVDPYALYVHFCKESGWRFDSCLLDQFIAAWSFMKGQGRRPWWSFTKERKSKFYLIEPH